MQKEDSGNANFRMGAIVRIKMMYFLTYDEVEVFPGSQLNMVVGPNGSGKSSIVSAICLGLAGNTTALGRAEKVSDYIKHGNDVGHIEIELFKANTNKLDNVVVRRTIDRENNTTWHIDNKRGTGAEVKRLTDRLHIHVNNLCVFLAQERVVSFAKLTPDKLLVETLKACDPELQQTQEKLSERKGQETQLRQARDTVQERLKILQRQQEEAKDAVEEFQRREEYLLKIDTLTKYRLWAEVGAAKEDAKKCTEKVEQAKAELEEEKRKIAPVMTAISKNKAMCEMVANEAKPIEVKEKTQVGKITEAATKLEEKDDEVIELEGSLKDIATREKQHLARKQKAKEELTAMEEKYAQLPEDADADARLNEIKTRQNALHAQGDEQREREADINKRIRQEQDGLKASYKRIEELQDAKVRKIKQMPPHTKIEEIWRTVQDLRQNNAFREEVFGPIFLEINVEKTNHATFLEKAIPWKLRTGYIVQNKADFSVLNDRLKSMRELSRVQPNIYVWDKTRQDYLKQTQGDLKFLQQFGVKKTLLETMTAPAAVKAILCAYANLHLSYYSDNQLDMEDMERVLAKDANDKEGCMSLYAGNTFSLRKFSKYGQRRPLTTTDVLGGQPQMLGSIQSNTDAEKQRLEKEVAGKEAAIKDLNAEKKELAQGEQSRASERELKELSKEREVLQQSRAARRTLKAKIEAQKKAFEKLASEKFNAKDEEKKIKLEIVGVNQERIIIVTKLVEFMAVKTQLLMQRNALTINLKNLLSLFQYYEGEKSSITDKFEEITQKLRKAEEQMTVHKTNISKLKKEAERIAPLRDWKEKFEEEWVPEAINDVDALLQELRVKADNIVNDPTMLKRFQDRADQIETLEIEAKKKADEYELATSGMAQHVKNWKEKLTAIVTTVTKKFAQYFASMNCEGEVRLHEVEDNFEKWEIQIWVSYRHGTPLKQLSGVAQSGGERSVATMLYLLCLQSVADCPFRVVDEINQGMDVVNERMIFDRIVDSSKGANTPQYFLVTPKLLPQLNYTRSITMIFVFNGPFMLDQKAFNMKLLLNTPKRPAGAARIGYAMQNGMGGGGLAKKPRIHIDEHDEDEDEDAVEESQPVVKREKYHM